MSPVIVVNFVRVVQKVDYSFAQLKQLLRFTQVHIKISVENVINRPAHFILLLIQFAFYYFSHWNAHSSTNTKKEKSEVKSRKTHKVD